MKNSRYFNMLLATYIATFLSGISLMNLIDGSTPNVIRSISRFHLYYCIARFMKNPGLMHEYITPEIVKEVRKYIPIKYMEFESKTTDADRNNFTILAAVNYSKEDYKSMIPYMSNGITKIGQGLLQLSVEVFVRSILGLQADVRWSIVGKGAMSLQSQEQFRAHVNNLIVIQSVKELVSEMRTAIQATHIVLNMAITPGVSLIPSSLVILKEPIEGHNNILLRADSTMTFGLNKNVNRIKREIPETKPKESVSKPVKQPLKNILHEEKLNEVGDIDKGINPVILFIPAIFAGSIIAHYTL